MLKSLVRKVRKRDGRIVDFEQQKIAEAIFKASKSVDRPDRRLAETVSDEVVRVLNGKYANRTVDVESIQDVVEKSLINTRNEDIARSYILYRSERTRLREMKQQLYGFYDDMKLPLNTVQVLAKRYLRRDGQGRIIETPRQMFGRIAKVIAVPERKYGGSVRKAEREFNDIMTSFEFVPNSPTIMNAGTPLAQLAACFVLPIEDSLESIFDTLKHTAIIHHSGGGVGFSFSRIRPRGDLVRSTMSVASGPISFMSIYDTTTNVIKQGGRRRGANMGILRCDHPDIIDFITSKTNGGLSNFNISVAATDRFMRAAMEGDDYNLINPRTKQAVKSVNAKEMFELITVNAWKSGDPGLVFIDEINKTNPTKHLGAIESTNPCGELPLHPYESCNLGSINLARFVTKGDVNWSRLRDVVHAGVHFLDNVIDANKFPLAQIAEVTKSNRRIGLGVMGFADMLAEFEIPYNSNEALRTGELMMKFINEEAGKKSVELGKERGSFPNFGKSQWKRHIKARRNATVTTIAPTGSISIIAGCSSGIEPFFAISFMRNVLEGTTLLETMSAFERVARERGFYSRDLMLKIARFGSIQKIAGIPKDVKDIFVTALDIEPEWHVKMQAAFQKHTENAVSKTVNLPYDATPEDVAEIYMQAYKLKCKGITVYRYGSKPEQVLYIGMIPGRAEEVAEEQRVMVESEFTGGCPSAQCTL